MNDLPFDFISRRSLIQLCRYGLIGIASNSAGYMIYLLITYLGVTPKIAMSLLYGVGAAVSFWGNRKLTFAHKGNQLGAGVRYVIAHCLGYFINLAILIIMVDKLGYAHQGVQVVAIFVVAIFLFFAFKFFVFRKTDFSSTEKL
jgi:putative flippase GtrA